MDADQAAGAAAGRLPHASRSGGAAADVQPHLAAGRATGGASHPHCTASYRALLDAERQGRKGKVTRLHISAVVACVVQFANDPAQPLCQADWMAA